MVMQAGEQASSRRERRGGGRAQEGYICKGKGVVVYLRLKPSLCLKTSKHVCPARCDAEITEGESATLRDGAHPPALLHALGLPEGREEWAIKARRSGVPGGAETRNQVMQPATNAPASRHLVWNRPPNTRPKTDQPSCPASIRAVWWCRSICTFMQLSMRCGTHYSLAPHSVSLHVLYGCGACLRPHCSPRWMCCLRYVHRPGTPEDMSCSRIERYRRHESCRLLTSLGRVLGTWPGMVAGRRLQVAEAWRVGQRLSVGNTRWRDRHLVVRLPGSMLDRHWLEVLGPASLNKFRTL
jgi:hypothetical protein